MSAPDVDRLEAELMRALKAANKLHEMTTGHERYWAATAADHIRQAIKAAGTREKLA